MISSFSSFSYRRQVFFHSQREEQPAPQS
uniref:Uncharacterized protein n=1 Tax=Anguilla anguilla TaxID=7936 RepID=A0A0E9WCF1_ANGAN